MIPPELAVNHSRTDLRRRAAILFVNFLLVILAYYQVKSASRSILIQYWGSDNLPYVWILSALVLGGFIGVYHRLVERHTRLNVVLGSCLLFVALLLGFRVLLSWPNAACAVAFYVLVDIFSVVLVEQFWSLANTVTRTEEGKHSYWFVGTGGLAGGVLGGVLAAWLVKNTPMQTHDLLLSCAGLLCLTFALNLAMGRMGMFREVVAGRESPVTGAGLRALLGNRYLILIALALFCSQMAQPLVEYQFLKTVEQTYKALDERTIFISNFFGLLGFVAIGVNLLITPFVHRYLGVVAGMTIQPLLLAISSVGFLAHQTVEMASAMKISDRGLSYSITRASKELLYIPIDPLHTYQAKAWIDMLGYRLFKILGSVLILLFLWVPSGLNVSHISWLTFAICGVWLAVVAMLGRHYASVALEPVAAT